MTPRGATRWYGRKGVKAPTDNTKQTTCSEAQTDSGGGAATAPRATLPGSGWGDITTLLNLLHPQPQRAPIHSDAAPLHEDVVGGSDPVLILGIEEQRLMRQMKMVAVSSPSGGGSDGRGVNDREAQCGYPDGHEMPGETAPQGCAQDTIAPLWRRPRRSTSAGNAVPSAVPGGAAIGWGVGGATDNLAKVTMATAFMLGRLAALGETFSRTWPWPAAEAGRP
jgi:hypothetical protein